MAFTLVLLPLISIIGIPLYIYYNGIVWQEPIMFVIGWFLAGSGITMGYHRLFAHKAFKAKPALEWILMLCGSMALQNTIVKWCSDHRRHHKKLDTNEDPYSIKKGFFHAHIGWIFKKGDYKKTKDFHSKNYKFFDAPVGLIFSIERDLGWMSWLDYGMFIQNISLLCRGFGVHSCSQAAWGLVYKKANKFLNLEKNYTVHCGMAIGYENKKDKINSLKTEMEKIETFCKFHG